MTKICGALTTLNSSLNFCFLVDFGLASTVLFKSPIVGENWLLSEVQLSCKGADTERKYMFSPRLVIFHVKYISLHKKLDNKMSI